MTSSVTFGSLPLVSTILEISKDTQKMDTKQAIAALGALAQETRLAIFRLLIARGRDGLPAGGIAEALDVPASSLSFHLAQLSHAGLIAQRRASRRLIYTIDFAAMDTLMGYLTENCCSGSAAACGSDDSASCAPAVEPRPPRRADARG